MNMFWLQKTETQIELVSKKGNSLIHHSLSLSLSLSLSNAHTHTHTHKAGTMAEGSPKLILQPLG